MGYKSINEIPIYNYQRILEGAEFTEWGVDSLEDWLLIEEEFFNQIGFGEGYFNNLRSRVKIVQLKAKYYATGNKFLKTLIRNEELKIGKGKEEEGESKGGSFTDLVAGVSKKMGFRVDPKEVSVSEFYSYLKLNA